MPGDETEPKKAESPVAAKPKPPEAAPGQVPASQQPWGGIAMLAHCAQNVEEESPAHPPAAKDGAPAPAPKPTSKKEHDSNYSRKEKSLGLLCDRFLQEYSNQPEVTLDAAANKLGVEKRRIYDIVNVLESVEVVSRKGKNSYIMHGTSRLPQALQRQYMLGSPENEESSEEEGEDGKPKAQGEGRKSLNLYEIHVLSQKFVRLCMHDQSGVVSLESAARRICADSSIDENRLKTKVRRLYDIANILCSLNLIEKTHLADGSRKPAFKWKYPCKHLGLDGSGAELKLDGKRPTEGFFGRGPAKKSKKSESKKRNSNAAGGAAALNAVNPLTSSLTANPALMSMLLNSMNAGAVGADGKAPAAASGSQEDMQAYLQAYMTQMAGMQSVLTSLAGVKPPEGEGIKDDGKGGAAKAPADAAALLAGAAGAGGADALVPGYLQMMMAMMGQIQGGAAGGAGGENAPPPPPPPPPAGDATVKAEGDGTVDPNATMAAMGGVDLQALQNAAAMWQMMSQGTLPVDGSAPVAVPGAEAVPAEVAVAPDVAAAPPPAEMVVDAQAPALGVEAPLAEPAPVEPAPVEPAPVDAGADMLEA